MALFLHFCAWVLLLLVSVLQVQGQHEDCSVVNNQPSIKENNDPGAVVTDITTAAGITVTIDPTLNYQWFEINGSQLILKDSVDYENETVLFVQLNCWSADLGMIVNDLMVTVTIENVNDNPPVFKETNITVHISEDTAVNTVVVPQANVTATDVDGDIIFYNLTGSAAELEYFKIQGMNNPQIVLQKALDYETINLMKFTLYAMDGNSSATALHTATAEITIHILQADLRPPWFQPCILSAGGIICINQGYTGKVNVSDNTTQPVILKPGPLYAIDGDRDLNATIVYEIVDGNDDNTFSIGQYTGNITLNKIVHTLKTFTLYVVATQENNPLRYSQTTVEIEVVRRNDHKPYFNVTYSGTIPVQSPVSSIVMEAGSPSVPIIIFAVDEDFPPDGFNPDIKYKIQNSTAFRVTSDGFLLTTEVLKVASILTLWAIANDTATLDEASTVITVDVTPLATTAIPTTMTSTTLTTTASITSSSTTAFPAVPGTGTSIPKPSSSTASLSPGINSTLPTAPSGPTKPTTTLATTTKIADNTGGTGKPVTVTTSGSLNPPYITTTKIPIITGNVSQPQTTSSPVRGTSQPLPGVNQTTGTTTAQSSHSGTTNSSPTNISGTTNGTPHSTSWSSSQIPTTITPISGGSLASRTTHSPAQTSQIGTTKPSTTGISITSSRTVTSTSLASQIQTTSPPIPGGSSAPSHTTHSPAQTSQGGTTKPSTTTISLITSRTAPSTSPTSSKTLATNPPMPGKGTAAGVTAQSTAGTPQPGPPTSSTTGAFVLYDQHVRNMAALGGTLGSLLLIALVLLGVISCKYYKMKQAAEEDNSQSVEGFTNTNFENNEKRSLNKKDDEMPANADMPVAQPDPPPVSKEPEESRHSSNAYDAAAEIEEGTEGVDSEKEVRSILTKERREEDDGYKAVWFKEDIDPGARDDVVTIEEYSDTEQNRNESDSDNADDRDDNEDGEDNNSGRGGSDVSTAVGRAQLPGGNSAISEFRGDGEASEIYF